MSIIKEPQRSKLFTRVKHLLGAPIRSIEIEDEMMDSLLELSIQDYAQYVNDWLIESQWTSLYGMNLDEQSVTRAFTTRSLDWETQYTYSYSKIVGLQAGGDYVLKKDFVTLKTNQQIYEIPAGREINELLWFTRAELDAAFFDPFMGGFGGMGGDDSTNVIGVDVTSGKKGTLKAGTKFGQKYTNLNATVTTISVGDHPGKWDWVAFKLNGDGTEQEVKSEFGNVYIREL